MIGDNVTGKEFRHVSIMLDECISYLKVKPDGIYADATLGGAGHASAVCAKLSENGIFIGSISRQALHCASLTFTHPITGETLTINAKLPEDMQQLLSQS